ncbi:bifunctional diaminohydroxyphosphoribosylaminopyrimidine deaminase/5-amino-6-(5-phosphoribosylamino)uracil reductase RibD [Chengkuizengella marina]|uniref:diaminohydroxyphosphoribosylaminopyrimidine deaminase n=1 Tax=Chengkuizengella marina TaxID=2507566 RepID=A0A6N9Q3D7_9BACL|nr:bifunctional diaminohydroxyphosphoribosylaminopyrimidine deaminase/5-amino-6-(5-phosphoribosylamino)uracil reductase RibD [Chengkuizengella marina]NBI29303.1 bifunctional diaminohydroxyphosphoribosylaminopyrimidine deaminase/5-amino-6-(5-phosphoribosylamino)uracil reductase RibD [Chengkuizengella marina]
MDYCKIKDIDEYYMNHAVNEGRKAKNKTGLNPPVGVVIVKNNNIIGKGYTSMKGGNHAEINAITKSKDESIGATLYSTLEPCSHYGLTPPCCEAVVKSGIKRVVIGIIDPYFKVNGKGIRYLRENGLEVQLGVLKDIIEKDLTVYLNNVNKNKIK